VPHDLTSIRSGGRPRGDALVSQASFQKRMREKARRERAEAKSARKQERRDSRGGDHAPSGRVDETAVLAELAALHARFAADEITFEDFEQAKAVLTAQLDVR
jgi:hypothetical protein